jgi:hypothetical protein
MILGLSPEAKGLLTALGLASVLVTGPCLAHSRSYERIFTPFELKRMTNDPATNPALADFAEKRDDPAAEAQKALDLAAFVSKACIGARENTAIIKSYAKARLSGLDPEKKKDAAFKARRLFDNLDYVDEAELCAGIDFLFGPKGVLLPNAVNSGSGEMDLAPFIRDNPQ